MFKQLMSDIADGAKKIYRYFAFLFDWSDILVTKNALSHLARALALKVWKI